MWVNLALTGGVQIALYWLLSTGVGSWPGIGINGIPIADVVFYLLRLGDARGPAATPHRRLRRARRRVDVRAHGGRLGGRRRVRLGRHAAARSALGPRRPARSSRSPPAASSASLVAFGLGRLFGVAEVAQGCALVRRVLGRRFARKA